MTKKELAEMEIHAMADSGPFAIQRVYNGWIYYDKSNGMMCFVPLSLDVDADVRQGN